MCRAAFDGAVDFAAADPRDDLWWARLAIALRHVERRSLAIVLRARHDRAAALLAAVSADPGAYTAETKERLDARSTDLIDALAGVLLPWEAASADRRTRDRAALESLWVEEWGDPADPATQAAIDATVAEMVRQAAEARAAIVD